MVDKDGSYYLLSGPDFYLVLLCLLLYYADRASNSAS